MHQLLHYPRYVPAMPESLLVSVDMRPTSSYRSLVGVMEDVGRGGHVATTPM